MARFLPLPPRRVLVAVPVDSSSVTVESLRYDLPETHPDPAEQPVGVATLVAEAHPSPVEDAGVGMLVRADTIHPAPATVEQAIATVTGVATHPPPVEQVGAIVTVGLETHPPPVVTDTLVFLAAVETQPSPVDIASIRATVTPVETHPVPVDLATVITTQVPDAHPAPSDAGSLAVDYRPWADGTAGDPGSWGDVPNAYDADSETFAYCSAASSGVGGITSNTANGELQLTFPTPPTGLSGLTIIDAKVAVDVEVGFSGLGLGRSVTCTLNFDEGGGDRELTTYTAAQARTLAVFDVPEVTDWSHVTAATLLCWANCVSGTGSGAITYVRIRRAELRITAEATI